MNVASLELCRELYELSGWELPKSDFMKWVEYPEGTSALWAGSNPEHLDEVLASYPAYPLGYLLRKLPRTVILESNIYPKENWSAQYYSGEPDDEGTELLADTPENAACKLAIELWKQGVLK
jgi:hypothetical protein